MVRGRESSRSTGPRDGLVDAPRVAFGPFTLDRQERLLRRHGREIPLPERSRRLLEVLIDAAGSTVSKDRLVDRVWQGACVSDTSLTEAMSRLRDALGDDARRPRYVRTVHGHGYEFIAAVEPARPAVAPTRRRRFPASVAASIALASAVGVAVAGFAALHHKSTTAAGDPAPRTAPRLRLAEYEAGGGKVLEYDVPSLPYNDLSVSRGGERLAFSIDVGPRTGAWVLEPRRGELRRITRDGSFTDPVWASDGRSLAMSWRRADDLDLVLHAADRETPFQVLLEAPHDQFPEAWLHRSRALVYSERHPATGYDLWVLRPPRSRHGSDGEWLPTPLVRTPADEAFAAVSPDDRYLAFTVKSGRRFEVLVLDLRQGGDPVTVSHAGGTYPFWSRTGDRLHYVSGDEVVTLERADIGHWLPSVRSASTVVPGLRFAAPAPAADRFLVLTDDSAGTFSD